MATQSQGRPLVFLAAGFLLSAVVSLLVADAGLRSTNRESSRRAAADYIALQKERVLGVIDHDLALARKLANTDLVRNWIRDPAPETFAPVLRELHSVVSLTSTGSAFVSSREALTFHFVDRPVVESLLAAGATSLPITQHLTSENLDSAWFYETLDHPGNYYLKVDYNTRLGVTMLWINVVMSDERGVVGVAGTSVDISDFGDTFGGGSREGIETFYVTPGGEIVGSHESRESLEGDKAPTFWSRLTDAEDATEMRAAMTQLQSGTAPVSVDVLWNRKPRTAGVAYLPQLGWYMVSLHAPPAAGLSATLAGGLIAAALVGTLLSAWLIRRYLLVPLRALESTTADLAARGGDTSTLPLSREDALGDLARAIDALAQRRDAGATKGVLPHLTRGLASLQKVGNLPALTQTLFSFLGPHLALGQASLYRLEPNSGSLRLCGGYGRQDGDSPPAVVELGQGLLGQCAVERRILRLPPPPDYLRIGSGLGSTAPASLEIRPVLDGDRVLAVVEMATLAPIDDAGVALLDGLWPALGMCMLALERNEHLQQLLSDVRGEPGADQENRAAGQPLA